MRKEFVRAGKVLTIKQKCFKIGRLFFGRLSPKTADRAVKERET